MNNREFCLDEAISVIEEVLASGGEFRLYPKGISMKPLIRQEKDSVTLKGTSDVALEKYDMAFYRRESGQFVLHRVMEKEADGSYTMCGDNQLYLEKGIRQDQIISRVECLYRKDRAVDFGGFKYRVYLKLWCCMPVRRFLMLPSRAVKKLKRILFKFGKSVD